MGYGEGFQHSYNKEPEGIVSSGEDAGPIYQTYAFLVQYSRKTKGRLIFGTTGGP